MAVYKEGGLAALLEKLQPTGTRWVIGSKKQFKRLQGCKDVMIVLGTCSVRDREPVIVDPMFATEAAVAALEKASGSKVLFIDIRKECRRQKSDKYCYRFEDMERKYSTAATALELEVGRKDFDLGYTRVVTFSEQWRKPVG